MPLLLDLETFDFSDAGHWPDIHYDQRDTWRLETWTVSSKPSSHIDDGHHDDDRRTANPPGDI